MGVLERRLVEPVDERLGAVVDATRAGPVGLGVRVDLRHRAALAAADVVRLVADLVETDHVLAERLALAGARDDDRFPARLQLGAVVGVQVVRAGGFGHQRAPQAVRDGGAVAGAGMQVVRALVLAARRDEVGVLGRAALRHVGGRVLADRVAGRGGGERDAVDVDAVVALVRLVLERDRHAVAAVGADRQRLDRVVAVLADRDLLRGLLRANGRDPVAQHVHLPERIVILEVVQGDVDVDGDDVEVPDGGTGRTDPTSSPTPRRGTGDSSHAREDERCRSHAHEQAATEATAAAREERDGKRNRERQGGVTAECEGQRQRIRHARLENLKADLGRQGHAHRRAGRNGRRANGRRRLPREPTGGIREAERDREADQHVAHRREGGRRAGRERQAGSLMDERQPDSGADRRETGGDDAGGDASSHGSTSFFVSSGHASHLLGCRQPGMRGPEGSPQPCRLPDRDR